MDEYLTGIFRVRVSLCHPWDLSGCIGYFITRDNPKGGYCGSLTP